MIAPALPVVIPGEAEGPGDADGDGELFWLSLELDGEDVWPPVVLEELTPAAGAGEGMALGSGDGETEGEADGSGEAEGSGETAGEGDADGSGEGETAGTGEAEGLAEGEGSGEADACGLALGPGLGSSAITASGRRTGPKEIKSAIAPAKIFFINLCLHLFKYFIIFFLL